VKFRIVILEDEEGAFLVKVPSLPGCISQGSTRQEAIRNAEEAIGLYLDSLKRRGDPIPPPIDEVVVDVPV
jgi:predicted RNase H-like HicB family nuclease